MKRYEDFKNESNKTEYLSEEELEKVKWTKYKIIVPTIEDKLELEKAIPVCVCVGSERFL